MTEVTFNNSIMTQFHSYRSQWRKLELAIRFIQKSKQSANEGNRKEKTQIVLSKRQNNDLPSKEEAGPPPKKRIKFEMKIEPKDISESTARLYPGVELKEKSSSVLLFNVQCLNSWI